MIDIIVQRGEGLNKGEDIVDPLITSVSTAIARGRMEIDSRVSKKLVELTTKHRVGVKTGMLIEVQDALMGKTWRGKITSVVAGVEGTVSSLRLSVERVG